MMNNGFRYDINGLRAYAVFFVVLFHFGLTGFSAGFIGVDIFFVISGFLMTGIVVRGIENGTFSIIGFYLSRGIRIIPALLVVCVVLLILGFFILLPVDYKTLAKHVISSLSFLSNIAYWKETGYFDAQSHYKPLLHTWSLSVEWQFYMLFPIVMAVLYRIKPSRSFLLKLIFFGVVVSFLLSVFISKKSPAAGFFLLPSRAWELLLGGVVFFIPSKDLPFKKQIEIFGFFLIVLSFYFFTELSPWPSYNALLPALGAFFILLACQQKSFLTNNLITQWLGVSSYSIYLWHWPVVFFIYYFYKEHSVLLSFLGAILSVFLGWCSYKLIEIPTRNKLSSLPKHCAFKVLLSPVAVVLTVSFVIYGLNGIKSRFPFEVNFILDKSNDKNPRINECLGSPESKTVPKCIYGSGPISLVVIGDSYADAMMNGITSAIPKNTSLVSYTVSSCQTILGLKKIDNENFDCDEKIKYILNDIKQYKNTPLLIVNMMSAIAGPYQDKSKYIENKTLIDGYIDTVKAFSKNNKVFLVSQTPRAMYNIPEYYAKEKYFKWLGLSDDNTIVKKEDFLTSSLLSRNAQEVLSKNGNINIIDITDFFCGNDDCSFIRNQEPILYDSHHMNWSASKMLSPIFSKDIFGD